MLDGSEELQDHFVFAHGMLAVLEVLEAKPSRDVTLNLLKIVNMVSVGWNRGFDITLILTTTGCDGRLERNGAHLFDWWDPNHHG